MTYLFVYGTLKNNSKHPMAELLKQSANYIGEGSIIGKLYHISWYPAFKKSNNEEDMVLGDVYQLKENRKESLIELLDEYEGEEYEKELLEVTFNKEKIKALVYVYKELVDENKRIISGNFINSNQ